MICIVRIIVDVYMGEVIMYEAVEYVGIILWVIYLILLMNREIKRKNKYNKEYNLKMIINEPFHLIRIDSVFFLIVYIFYSNLSDVRALPYLYVIIMITNVVYVLYDIADNYKDNKISFKKELINYFGVIIILLIALIYMLINKNVDGLCLLTLILNLLIPIYIWVVNMIKNNGNT